MKKWLTHFASISPVVFVLATFLIGLVAPGYNHLSMTVSRLSLGSYGWIQSINLIIFALALIVASEFLIKNSKNRSTRKALHSTFIITAIVLTLLAIFPTDPIDSFPKQLRTISWSAAIHFLLVGMYVLITPLGILVLTQTFKLDKNFNNLIFFTFATGFSAFTLSIIWFAFFYFGILDGFRGLFQKGIILEVLIWLTIIMHRLKAQAHHDVSASPQA